MKSTLADYREATFLWHMDGTGDDVPNMVTLLTARQIAVGDDGDTEIADTYAEYEALPETEKVALEPLRVVHSFANSQRRMKPNAPAEEQALWERVPAREHPLVWHRRDGRTSLVIGTTAGVIVGLEAEEGEALIERLNAGPPTRSSPCASGGMKVTWSCSTTRACSTEPFRTRRARHGSCTASRPRARRPSPDHHTRCNRHWRRLWHRPRHRPPTGEGGFPVAVLDLNNEAPRRSPRRSSKPAIRRSPSVGSTPPTASRSSAVRNVKEAIGPALVLINNAGITATQSFMKITPESWERMISVNLTGPYHFCHAVFPGMLEAGWGRIVNFSSSSAQSGQAYMVHYVASKAGLIGLTKALALELGPKGITVNTVPPGFVDTPMLRDSEARGYLAGSVDDYAQRTPVRRPGRPEDIANACSFLVTDDASNITGQVLGVNGGRNT